LIAQAREHWKGVSASQTILIISGLGLEGAAGGENITIYMLRYILQWEGKKLSSLCSQLVGSTYSSPLTHPATELPDNLKIEFPNYKLFRTM